MTTTKTNAPKWVNKTNATIQTLKAKSELTSFEWVRLTNAELKIADKSLSKIYKKLGELETKNLVGILGKSKFPSFKEFTSKAKNGKELFSVYDGLMILRKFNKSEQTKAKISRQNKTLSKVA